MWNLETRDSRTWARWTSNLGTSNVGNLEHGERRIGGSRSWGDLEDEPGEPGRWGASDMGKGIKPAGPRPWDLGDVEPRRPRVWGDVQIQDIKQDSCFVGGPVFRNPRWARNKCLKVRTCYQCPYTFNSLTMRDAQHTDHWLDNKYCIATEEDADMVWRAPHIVLPLLGTDVLKAQGAMYYIYDGPRYLDYRAYEPLSDL